MYEENRFCNSVVPQGHPWWCGAGIERDCQTFTSKKYSCGNSDYMRERIFSGLDGKLFQRGT
jgi:hypothetical protein